MISDFYSILGVSPTASEADIKAAFKQLAKKYHPDKNEGNEVAEEHFKKINNAYQVLSDKTKRARYDLIVSYQAQKKQAQNSPTVKPHPPRNQYKTNVNRSNSPQTKKKNIKYTIYVVMAFLVFGTAVLFFSRYMNRITAKQRLKEGIILEENFKLFTALEYYSQAIDYDPSLSEAYIRRARLRFIVLKDTSGAKADFEDAIKNNPEKSDSLIMEYAKFKLQLKDYTQEIVE